MATAEDDRIEERNHEKEREAYRICQEKIEKHGTGNEAGAGGVHF